MKTFIALAGTTLAMSFTAVAGADTSVTDAYGGQSTVVPSTVVTPNGTAPEVIAPTTTEVVVGNETETQEVAGATATSPAAGTAPATGTAPTTAAAPSAPQAVASGSLPFTGLDVGLMIAGGLLLVGFGLGMRRLSRSAAPLA